MIDPKPFNMELAQKLIASPKFQLPFYMQKAAVETIDDLRARLAEVEAERDALREDLAWYADTFCEEGPYSEVCGRLSPDECSGCRARQALGDKP